MKIKSLTFVNHKTGWNIKDAQFANTTLLVGASGVGKTQILRALLALRDISKGTSLNAVEWDVWFSQNGKEYRWGGKFGLDEKQEGESWSTTKQYPVVKEYLLIDDTELISRDKDEIKYKGEKIVKLDPNRSAISLLKEEEDVANAVVAFRQIYQLDTDDRLTCISTVPCDRSFCNMTLDDIEKQRSGNTMVSLFLLKENNLPEYSAISEIFKGIFPLVEKIDFTLTLMNEKRAMPVLRIKEKGCDAWISSGAVSSGMYRALSQIVTLTLAKDGDVILIDEFENGLGVNCIDLLADLVRNPDADVQMIITSHHPYIINTMPTSQWKVVTRNGSDVSIHNASELNIGTHSHHDAFMQLLQTNAYKTGQL